MSIGSWCVRDFESKGGQQSMPPRPMAVCCHETQGASQAHKDPNVVAPRAWNRRRLEKKGVPPILIVRADVNVDVFRIGSFFCAGISDLYVRE